MSPTTLSSQFYSNNNWTRTPTNGDIPRQHRATTTHDERIMQQAAMQERSRLARELHDSVTQSLFSLTLMAEGWRRMAADGEELNTVEVLTELGDLGKQALKEARLLVYELRPPVLEEEGLVGALQKRLSAVEKRAGIDVKLVSGLEVELHPEQEKELYWFVHEALANSLKHSGAEGIQIHLTTTQEADIVETDRQPAKSMLSERESPGRVFEALAQPALRLPALARFGGIPFLEASNPVLLDSAYQASVDSHTTTFAGHRGYDTPIAKPFRDDRKEQKKSAASFAKTMGTPALSESRSRLGRKEATRANKSIILEIEDNGCGFDTAVLDTAVLDTAVLDTVDAGILASNWGGMGLRSMQERADKLNGTFTIHSVRGKGTRIRLVVPVIQC